MILILLFAVTLSWNDPNSFELGTIVEKTISGNCTSGFFEVARPGVNITLWTDELGQPGDCYRVAPFASGIVAPWSNTAQVPVLPPPPCKNPNNKGKKCQ